MTSNSNKTALVADLGGTNTRVALARDGIVDATSITKFRNADYPGLPSVLREYVSAHAVTPDAASVAMAGPVRDGVGRLTNLDWTVDKASVAAAIGANTVAILNDLQAQGHAVDHLTPDALHRLLPGTTSGQHAAKLVVGIGTGMNAAAVYRLGDRTLVPPSEAGHVSLPVQDATEQRLFDFIARKHGTPGFEDVLSGRGFERVYAWICAEQGAPNEVKDAAAIMEGMNTGNDPRAQECGQVFTRFLGRAISNLALVHLPFGGIYLIGGVVRHFAPHLLRFGFGEAFEDKGRFSDFMQQFPVHVVTDDYAALTGCASHMEELTAGD